jgi:ABC-type polar amino acid transport system ATPase subunit
MAQTPIIVAEEVTKRFGTHQVLTRVSLPVMERDVVCVVGPSGSGKTTLLRCFALLERPSEGRIVMQGTTIATPDSDRQTRPRRGRCGPTSAWCSSTSICGRTCRSWRT